MADFKQAIEWMKEGRKVRINSWAKGIYLKQELDTSSFKLGEIINENGERNYFMIGWYDSTKWEIYEEEDDWKLTDFNNYNGHSDFEEYTIDTVKILKEKILEDIYAAFGWLEDETLQEFDKILDKRFGF